jgi:hypothetical protein
MANTAVGKEALAYCTSCKMDLGHTVVAMKGDRIAKVQCRTCKKEHAYKAPKGVTEPTAEKPAKKASKKAAAPESNPIELEWEKLMNAHKDVPLRPYGMKTKYALGDRLSHPNFGEGIVGKLIYPNKIEVIFRTDVKVLIHGGA